MDTTFQIILLSLTYKLLMARSLNDGIKNRTETDYDEHEEDDLFDISYKNNTRDQKVDLETFLELILNTGRLADEGIKPAPNLRVKNKDIGDMSSWLFYPGLEYSFLRSPGRWRVSGTRRIG